MQPAPIRPSSLSFHDRFAHLPNILLCLLRYYIIGKDNDFTLISNSGNNLVSYRSTTSIKRCFTHKVLVCKFEKRAKAKANYTFSSVPVRSSYYKFFKLLHLLF
jgi:hypothetical protein